MFPLIHAKKLFSITNKGKPTHCKAQSNKTNTFVIYLAGGEGHNRKHLEKMKIIMADTETMMIFADFIQKVFHGISKIVKKHDLLQKFLYIIFFTQN